MAKKTVEKLKDKHRNRTWLDRHGNIWFWNTELRGWMYLIEGVHPNLEPGFIPATPYFSELIGRIDEFYGPFTQLTKAIYED